MEAIVHIPKFQHVADCNVPSNFHHMPSRDDFEILFVLAEMKRKYSDIDIPDYATIVQCKNISRV